MRILISSLQVSQSGSRGHLHPALELGLELKQRNHHVGFLPLPGNFNPIDEKHIKFCGFEIISPPVLPSGILLSADILGKLAKNPETVSESYYSFLVAPLKYQFEEVTKQIKIFRPDIIIYDLLVYAAPIAARLLNILDVGFCAGLKLIAPDRLMTGYQSIYQKISPAIHDFFIKYGLNAEFHYLELLSNTYQFVFTPPEWINAHHDFPRKTILAGSLPMSEERDQSILLDLNDENFVLLCFGSALDPANYPEMTGLIIKVANLFQQKLIIISQKPDHIPQKSNIIVKSYLSLPPLLKKANILIHHGGANTFSESLTIGTPQILVPLTTDQPIQAELLKKSGAGMVIYPHEMSEENLSAAFKILLNPTHTIHNSRLAVKKIFQSSNGVKNASDMIEKTIPFPSYI